MFYITLNIEDVNEKGIRVTLSVELMRFCVLGNCISVVLWHQLIVESQENEVKHLIIRPASLII